MHAERAITILWVTHSLDQARRVSQYAWLLVDDRLVETAPTAQFFEEPQNIVTRSFLGGNLDGGTLS